MEQRFENAGRTHLDALHNAQYAVSAAVYDVLSVAHALKRVGMHELASELSGSVEALEGVTENILKTWMNDQDAQMAHGQEMLGGIMMLGMKMCEAAKEPNDGKV